MIYADILILALIAGFILLRLRSVLGQKTGLDVTRPAREALESPVVTLADRQERSKSEDDADAKLLETLGSPGMADTLAELKKQDPRFTLTHFMNGAVMAFEMVHDAFAKSDKDTLKQLLSSDIATLFEAEIEKRNKAEVKSETTLLSVKAEKLESIFAEGGKARIQVKFLSEQVTLERDKTGAIVKGDPRAAETVEDVWTFEREITSRNPNWKIIDT